MSDEKKTFLVRVTTTGTFSAVVSVQADFETEAMSIVENYDTKLMAALATKVAALEARLAILLKAEPSTSISISTMTNVHSGRQTHQEIHEFLK